MAASVTELFYGQYLMDKNDFISEVFEITSTDVTLSAMVVTTIPNKWYTIQTYTINV